MMRIALAIMEELEQGLLALLDFEYVITYIKVSG